MQRRTAEALEPLGRQGFLVLHDLTLPGWPASLDHLVVGPTGVCVIQSWGRPRFARLRGFPSPRLRWQAEAIAEALPAGAQIPVRPLLCVRGRRSWLAGPPPAIQDVRVANLREFPDVVRNGLRARDEEVELATARLVEVLHPAV
jgi:hypothetical protein